MSESRRQRIVVPTRVVQGGFDIKFETDSYDVKLYGILSPQQYSDIIQAINQKIKPARSNAIDKALLVTGPLLVPLAVWGARHGLQTRKRKRLLRQAIEEFNEEYPELLMRWNRGSPESKLTIERRQVDTVAVPIAAASLMGEMVRHPLTAQDQPIGVHGNVNNLVPATEASMVV